MPSWDSGYVSEIDYIYGYYAELNPTMANLGLTHAGINCSKIETACELGFGQGVSVNIHAASSDIEWYGTDFNPTQAAFAQELASLSESDAKLYDQAFEEFCFRNDLPDFDFIALHGIWSWISEHNRLLLRDFIGRKLKVGGVVYMGYNTLPGWSTFAPLRHLMTLHAEITGSKNLGISNQIDQSFEYLKDLFGTDALYNRLSTNLEEQIEELVNKSREYIAHEFFNKNWDPMYFSTVSAMLSEAKVSFACSASFIESMPGAILTKKQIELINKIANPVLRESTQDYIVNQRFRKDYWVKGKRRLNTLEQFEKLQDIEFILISEPSKIDYEIKSAQGINSLNKKIYTPIIDLLADRECMSIKLLFQKLKASKHEITFNSLVEALMVLTSKYDIAPTSQHRNSSSVLSKVNRLNRAIANKARSSTDIKVLASPVIGGGIRSERFDQCFLHFYLNGSHQVNSLAKDALELIRMQSQKIIIDGKVLETEEENFVEFTRRSERFLKDLLPIYKKFQVVDFN